MKNSFKFYILAMAIPVMIRGQQVSDIDGNQYPTVVIGTQEWMAENLRTTRFNDGSPIQLVTSSEQWRDLEGPGYCWYDSNQLIIEAPYGIHYNWFAIHPKSNGSKNICPLGWHVPSDAEWQNLEGFLDAGDNMTGHKLKSADLWTLPENPVVTIRTGVERNSTGFNGLPAGMRDDQGKYWGLNFYGFWWSSTQSNKHAAKARGLIYNTNTVSTFSGRSKKHGLSIRCVKD
jgi:uncharacterized protein (TIGR02145 family)